MLKDFISKLQAEDLQMEATFFGDEDSKQKTHLCTVS